MICRACLRARAGAAALRSEAPQQASRLVRRQTTQPFSSLAPSLVPLQRTVISPSSLAPAIPPQPAASRRLFSASTARRQEASTSAPAPEALEKPESMSDGEVEIWDKLVAELAPVADLEVRDISGGCGSMYYIDVSSERFRGLNMLKQQRMVNAALGDLVKQWHGVQLKTRVP
ncbi:bola protein [Echria macrotheca]|uniref:Bola protein n=1 Tax=Echria macrotheca TaxID=438768 RepID=A0AAJ0BGL9_9PEZI|nr:bola protein [Echria macrotheca]